MIVRERENEFVMIEQADHSVISGDCFANWKPELLPNEKFAEAVRYAITNHDFGWKEFDEMPFWNDVTDAPYNFMDFPSIPKLVFYKNGVDQLENLNPYAGMLASRHYSHLVTGDTALEEANIFIRNEQERRDRLSEEIEGFDSELFDYHYGLLALCDNFSLYVCLNERGADKSEETPLFRNGIPNPLTIPGCQKFDIKWANENQIRLTPFPFKSETTFVLKQRIVSKDAIRKNGLIKGFQDAPVEEVHLSFID